MVQVYPFLLLNGLISHGSEPEPSALNHSDCVGTWTAGVLSARIQMEVRYDGKVTWATSSGNPLSGGFSEPNFVGGSWSIGISSDFPAIRIVLDTPGDGPTHLLFRRVDDFLIHVSEEGEAMESEDGQLIFRRDSDGAAAWFLETCLPYYYLNPDPKSFLPAVKALNSDGMLKGDKPSLDLVGLFSQILAQNPEQVEAWMMVIDRMDTKPFWDQALYLSGTDAGKKILLNELEDKGWKTNLKIQKGPPEIDNMAPVAPWVLDLNWGAFLASGNPDFVRNCIRAFNLVEYEQDLAKWETSDKTEEDSQRANLGGAFQAARWSVHSRCIQHSKVLLLCEELLDSGQLTPSEASTLSEILASPSIQVAKSIYKALAR